MFSDKENNFFHQWDQQDDDKDQRTTIKEMLKCIDIHDDLENIKVIQKTSSNLSKNQQPKTQENGTVTSNLRQSLKDLSSETSHGLNTSAITNTLYSMGVIKKTDQLDEEELDFLLSIKTSEHQHSLETPLSDKEEYSTSPQIDFKKSTQVAEVETSKNSTTPQADKHPATISETPSDTQNPKEDLEDWLDSVLG